MSLQVEEKKKNEQPSLVDESKQEQEPKLSGAFISVLIVGAFIVSSWLAVYFLFLSR